MKEALVYRKLSQNKTRCLICQRKCVIALSRTGFCQTKKNQNGQLYALNYGLITGIQADPIEKKPLYHFHPGSTVASIGSFGCNFRCKQCLNYPNSWSQQALVSLRKVQPFVEAEEIVRIVKISGYPGIAFTYNEPVIWSEFALAIAKLAKKEKMFTVFVTNGSWTKETLDKVGPYLDAANIDLKGFSQKTYTKQGAYFGKIPEMAVYAQKKHRIFLELTTLLIPRINDNEKELKKMTKWIAHNLGPQTPWHLSRFNPELAPDPEFQKISPTTVNQLRKAAEVGRQNGLKHIYIWAPGQDLPGGYFARENTDCPNCGRRLIERTAWSPRLIGLKNSNCRYCRQKINLIR